MNCHKSSSSAVQKESQIGNEHIYSVCHIHVYHFIISTLSRTPTTAVGCIVHTFYLKVTPIQTCSCCSIPQPLLFWIPTAAATAAAAGYDAVAGDFGSSGGACIYMSVYPPVYPLPSTLYPIRPHFDHARDTVPSDHLTTSVSHPAPCEVVMRVSERSASTPHVPSYPLLLYVCA